MSSITKMYWLHALTPLHVGAGRGVGFIDMPIMREKVTAWPLIPGSAIKGVISDYYQAATQEQRSKNNNLKAAFGIADNDDTTSGANAGAIVFTDAKIICLPVRSIYGTFAWVTSPLVLQRLKRDLLISGLNKNLPEHIDVDGANIHLAKTDSVLKDDEAKVYLEDLDLSIADCPQAKKWGEKIGKFLFPEEDDKWQSIFQKRFAIISNDIFDFLCETATQVDAHIRIEPDTKTVVEGALWYEESLPAESILAGIAHCDKVFTKDSVDNIKLMENYCSSELNLQLGGKATTGKGRVRCIFNEVDKK